MRHKFYIQRMSMRTVTLEYKTVQDLEQFITENDILDSENTLLQIFTSSNDKEYILNLIQNILLFLPNVNIIGTTTSGEISNRGSLIDSTVISFSTFNSTKISTKLLNLEDDSYHTGINFINQFENNNSDELKLIITFTDGLSTNGEEFLAGVSSVNNKVTIAGGMAGDYSKFEKTYVFTKDSITSSGVVGAAFYNKNLQVYTDYSFDWETVGKKHLVEKSEKNRVYQIGGKTPVDFYKYYLGEDMGRLLPAIGIEFPLVMNKDGVNIARAVLTKHDDGSLSFAGNITEGSYVQFGHGDIQMIINKGLNSVKSILNHPIESIFIYSCMARKALLQQDINLEILPLKELAPISGFFTYGEFYNSKNDNNDTTNKLLNQTMTVLAISENNDKIEKVSPNIFHNNLKEIDDINLHRTQALSILIEKTTKELEELNQTLEQRVKEEVKRNIEKDEMLQVVQMQAQLGEMIEMIIHQWRQPISAITSSASSAQVYKDSDMLTDDILDDTFNQIIKSSEHLNNTIEDFRELFNTDKLFKSINPTTLINKSLTIVNPIISKYKIKLQKEYDSHNHIEVPIGLMMQVILNIVKNAIDALVIKDLDEPIIKIITYDTDQNNIIEIWDNGGAIPKEILPKIFKKKFTTKDKKTGTGIGLDMSKTIIETKIGGTITAHNVGEDWAVFTISLPKHNCNL